NITQEEVAVVLQIEELEKNGIPLNEVAVIYHRHAQAENIIQLVERRGIPYQVKRKINVLDLPLIQNIITLFQFLDEEFHQPQAGEHFLFELMHFKFFGNHPLDVAAVSAYAGSKRKENFWREIICDDKILSSIKLRNKESVLKTGALLNDWIAEVSNLTLPMLFEKILNDSGLMKQVITGEDKTWNIQVITTFFNFIKAECEKKPRMKIKDMLDLIEQMNSHGLALSVNKSVYKEDGVNFITCHSAKGLEFQYVFLIGCTSDKWESARSGNFNYSLPDTLTFTSEENELESKRRLFYVAMTRAKEHLIISYAAKNNDGKDLEASQFVTESAIVIEKKILEEEKLIDMQVSLLLPAPVPKIELFDEEYITQQLESFSLSVSALNNYLNCPLAFYFQYILKVPSAKNDSMAFGSAVHFSLKRLFDKMKINGDKFPAKEEILNDFKFEMYRNKDSFTEKQFQNRLALGQQILPEYFEKYVSGWKKIVLTEYRINRVEADGVPINGMIDKMEFTGRDVNVVDYKTGSVQYGLKKLAPPNENLPLKSYPQNLWVTL
ncbi:MAG: 3'-5' exonuclease, partial [Chitinophagales bacterium]